MTSEIGETFNWLRKEGQKNRAANRRKAPELLSEAGIRYESKNGGAHFIVDGPNGKVDFWPGTGLWMARKETKRGRGVFRLIKYVNGSGQ